MSLLLDGKSAIVTGGGSGIGRATAVALAREGARVLVQDRVENGAQETVGLINSAGGQAISIGGDVTVEDDVIAMVAKAVTTFGRLDCAFNNAGISPAAAGPTMQRTHELSLASWQKVIDVNLTGVFLCMKHQIPHLLEGGGGAIVNTASVAGLVGLPTASAYVGSKHGVIGITKTAAMEYAREGIRVNAVCPGYVLTPMTQDGVARRGEELLNKVPMHRLGRPEEIAEAVVWLCSERASFVTGSFYTVDGGYYAA
jgi:NAD(P)-dependent dehydrogenase (short-subunit alcohol dehydrogenase family)